MDMENQRDKKRVLIINTIGMGFEGISFVILNYLQHMSLEGLELHTIATPKSNPQMREKMEKFCTVHTLPRRQNDLKGYLRGLREIFRQGIDVLHVHGNSGTMAIEVVLAKLCGVKKILVHAHSTRTDHPAVNAVLKYPMMWLADQCIGCSEAAGRWLYGKHPYVLLNNAIDLERFRFDPESRDACRAEFGIGGEFVMGHIGNFYEPKNHPFLIDIFAAFHKREPSAKLLLAGGGPRVAAAEEKVKSLHLQDAVIFAGKRTDPERLYQALDAFVMPSLWEGLPLVLLEAQASGLPVLASDRITKEVRCAENFRYLPLEPGVEIWVENLIQLSQTPAERSVDSMQPLRDRGFDILLEAEKLRRIYLA